MGNFNHIDEIFGTPLDEITQGKVDGKIQGWQIVLGMGVVAAIGVGTYYYLEYQQNKLNEE